MKKRPPFEFVLEELGSIVTAIKPMFGAYGVYHENKILMILWKKDKPSADAGIWFGIPDDHILDVKKEIPSLQDLQLFGTAPTAWQVLRESDENFEEMALHICELIRKRDSRFGRIPKSKLPKSASKIKIRKKKTKAQKLAAKNKTKISSSQM